MNGVCQGGSFTYETTLSESVTERLLREEITHSTGMTMNDPDILVPKEVCHS